MAMYLILLVAIYPFQRLLCPRYRWFRTRPDEQIVPEPNINVSREPENEMSSLQSGMLLELRRGRFSENEDIGQIILSRNSSGAQDAEALILLRRRLRRDRVIRRRILELQRESKL